MPPQFVYTMKGLGKVYPPDAQVLKDIWLSFLPGRQDRRARPERRRQVHAAQDHGRRRDQLHRRGVRRPGRLGRLPAAGAAAQSRQGRPRQRRRRRRRDQGAARSLRRHQREARRGHVARGDGQGPRRAVEAAGRDRRHQRVGPRLAPRPRDGRAAAAAAGRRRHDALGRRAAPRGAVPAAAAVARPAAARRTDQPPRRRIGGVARALPQGLSRAPSSPSRTIATSSTTSPAGSSSSIAAAASRTKATTPAGSSRSRTGCSRKRRPSRSASARCSASWTGSACRRAPARPRARRASTPTNSCSPKTRAQKVDTVEIYIPPGPRLGDIVVEARGLQEGVRRHRAVRRPDLHAAARRHRRRDRPERRRQDHDVPDDHGAGAARCRHAAARRDRAGRLRRSVPRRARRRTRRSSTRSPAAPTS